MHKAVLQDVDFKVASVLETYQGTAYIIITPRIKRLYYRRGEA
ncbi:MAG: hypothetical protein QGI86_13660 [Candidatus Poribacteria bacterium]|nr:hypothetical protein [Candidatus Poribacteria bacterium]MDP6995432.1 hypothetical protein [Candidatus Poribacteria bacterium]